MCRLHVRQCCPDHQRRGSGIALLLTGIPALVAVVAVSLTSPVFLSLVPVSALLVVAAIGTLQVAGDEISYFDMLPPRRAMVFSTIAVGTTVIFFVKAFMWILLVTIRVLRSFGDRNR